MNVLIPMAGAGSRFKEAGYKDIKPMIRLPNGKTIIETVLQYMDFQYSLIDHVIFVVQKEHEDKWNISKHLYQICPKALVIYQHGRLPGQAASCMVAEKFINDETPLTILNCDNAFEWSSKDFMEKAIKEQLSGLIATIKVGDNEPRWSFAKVDSKTNLVVETAEKRQISNDACAGAFYFKAGAMFCRGVTEMMQEECMVNNEYYVSPVYNYFLPGAHIKTYEINKFWDLGTPQGLELFLKNK